MTTDTAEALPLAAAKVKHPEILVGFAPGEFSLTDHRHEQFVRRMLGFAETQGIDLLSGTEASDQRRNNTRSLLIRLAPQFGFTVYANPHGEWNAVADKFGTRVARDFIPVIPAQHGLASEGAHDARGINTITVKPHDKRIGRVHNGVAHWLTKGTDLSTARGRSNQVLMEEIEGWGREVAHGSDLAFFSGDTNRDDRHRDAFTDGSFESVWDETGQWPVTHPHADGSGPTLDLIASWLGDGRVRCTEAHAWSDDELALPVDHYLVTARFRVKPLGG